VSHETVSRHFIEVVVSHSCENERLGIPSQQKSRSWLANLAMNGFGFDGQGILALIPSFQVFGGFYQAHTVGWGDG
jgi:hypothetical protein